MKITKLFNKFIALTVTICLIVSVTSVDAFSAVQSPKETDMPVISLDNGKITSVNDTGSNLTVVNIQDLHCHKETQKKISNIIEEINKENKVKEIYVEGGYDKIDVGWLNEIKDKKVKEQIVDQLLEDGEITAGEYYAAMKDNNVQLKGLDEKVTHQQNLKRLSRIMNDQDRYASVISKVRNEIARLNDRYINYENRKFSEKIKEYKNEGGDSGRLYIKLFKYIDRINENFDQYNNITKIVKENYPNMATYIRLDKESKRINPEEISNQVKAILTDLKAVLSYSEYSDIITKTNNLRDINKLVWYINKYTTEKNINLSKYGSLSKFLEIRQMTASLNPVKLLEEERELIEQIRYALSYDKTEYEIAYISDFEEYFEKYLKYGLTSTDWHFTKKGFNKFRQLYTKYAVVDRIKEIEQDFVELDKYYNTNDERNSIFVNNILDGQKADNIAKPGIRTVKDIIKDSKEVIIVVAGGYHSDELSNMLSEESVNDIVITPNITGDIEKASNKYKQTIKEQAILQAQALAFRIASCSDDITQQKLLLKAGMEALKKGNINEREIENIIKVIKNENNDIDIKYENGTFELNGQKISLEDLGSNYESLEQETQVNFIGEIFDAAIAPFKETTEKLSSKEEINKLYIDNINKLLFSVAVVLSDSNGLPSFEMEKLKNSVINIDGNEYSIENIIDLPLETQDKLAEKFNKEFGIRNAKLMDEYRNRKLQAEREYKEKYKGKESNEYLKIMNLSDGEFKSYIENSKNDNKYRLFALQQTDNKIREEISEETIMELTDFAKNEFKKNDGKVNIENDFELRAMLSGAVLLIIDNYRNNKDLTINMDFFSPNGYWNKISQAVVVPGDANGDMDLFFTVDSDNNISIDTLFHETAHNILVYKNKVFKEEAKDNSKDINILSEVFAYSFAGAMMDKLGFGEMYYNDKFILKGYDAYNTSSVRINYKLSGYSNVEIDQKIKENYKNLYKNEPNASYNKLAKSIIFNINGEFNDYNYFETVIEEVIKIKDSNYKLDNLFSNEKIFKSKQKENKKQEDENLEIPDGLKALFVSSDDDVFKRGDKSDKDIGDEFDRDEFFEKYKQYCEDNNEPLDDNEQDFLKIALYNVKNPDNGIKMYGADALLALVNENKFEELINREVLRFIARSESYAKYNSIPGSQLIFVKGLEINEEQEDKIIELIKKVENTYDPKRQYLATENDGLAIKLFLDGHIGKELNSPNIMDEYRACIKIARYLAFYTVENSQDILRILGSKEEKDKQIAEKIVESGILWYKAQVKVAQNTFVLNEETKTFEMNSYQKTGLNAENMMQPSILVSIDEYYKDKIDELEADGKNYKKWEKMGVGVSLKNADSIEELDAKISKYKAKKAKFEKYLEENYQALNVSKNDVPEENLKNLFDNIKSENTDTKMFIRFNTHGHPTRIMYYYDDGKKENKIEYPIKDNYILSELISYFAENGYDEENIIFDFSTCHSYEYVLNIYKMLEEQDIDFFPSCVTATGLETLFGYNIYMETLDESLGVIKGKAALEAPLNRNGAIGIKTPLGRMLWLERKLSVINHWFGPQEKIKDVNNPDFNLTFYDFIKYAPSYSNHTVFMSGSVTRQLNQLTYKQIDCLLNGNEDEYNEITGELESVVAKDNYNEFKKEIKSLADKHPLKPEEKTIPYVELSVLGNDKLAPVWEEIVFGGIVTGLIAVFVATNPLAMAALFIAARIGFIGAHSLREYFRDGKDKTEILTNFKARLFPATILSVPYAIALFGSSGIMLLPALAIATEFSIIMHYLWNNNEEKIRQYLSKIPFIKNLPYLEMNVLKEESKYKDDVDVLENAIKNNQIENVTARATTDSYSSPLFMSLIYKGEDSRYYQGEDEDAGKYNVSKELNSGTVINLSISDFAVFAGNDLNNFSYALTYFFNRASYQDGPTILDEIEGLDDEYKEEVLYFLYESFKNALYHGNKLDSDEPVYIWLEKSKKGLTFKVANRVNDIQRDRRLEEKAEMIGITGKGAAHNKMSGWADADDNIIFETGETSNGKYYVSSFTVINEKEKEKVFNTVRNFSKDFKDIYQDEFVFTSIQGGGFIVKEVKKPKLNDFDKNKNYRKDLKELEDIFLLDDRFYGIDNLYDESKNFGISETELKEINYIRVMQNKENNYYLAQIINNKDLATKVRLLAYGYFMSNNGDINDLQNLEDLKNKTKKLLSECIDDIKINEKEIETDVDLRAVGAGVALILLDEKYEIGGIQNNFIKLSKVKTQELYELILNSNIVKPGDGTAAANSNMFFASVSIGTIAHEIGHNIFDLKQGKNKNLTLQELAADVSASMLMQILDKNVIKNMGIKDYANKLFSNGTIRNGIEFSFLEEHNAAKGLIFLLFTTVNRYLGREMSFSEFFMFLLGTDAQDAGYNDIKNEEQSISLVKIIDVYINYLENVYKNDKGKIDELKQAIKETDSWKIVVPEIIRGMELDKGNRNLYEFVVYMIKNSSSPEESYKAKYESSFYGNRKRIEKELASAKSEEELHLIIYNSLFHPSTLIWIAEIIENYLNTLSDNQIKTITLEILKNKNIDIYGTISDKEKSVLKDSIKERLSDEEKNILIKLIIIKDKLDIADKLILQSLLEEKGVSGLQINEFLKNNVISSFGNDGGDQLKIRSLFGDGRRSSLSYDERKYVVDTMKKAVDSNEDDILDALNYEQEMVIKLKIVSAIYNKIQDKFVTREDVYKTLTRILEKTSKDETINEEKLDNETIIETLEEVISEGYKKDQNLSSAALLPENKNEVRRFAENNYETLNFKTMLKKSIEMAYKEFSPSFSSKFVRNHYSVDKQTAKNLQKVTIASSAIFGILGFVSIVLNPVVYVAIPVVFAVAALISGTNMAYHTAIIYRYINSIKDIKDDFGNAVRIEDNNETYLSVYVTNDIGKYDGKKIPLGENINGNRIYKINKDGFIIVGVAANEISSEEIIENLDAGLLGSKTKGMNINKIVIDNNISDEFDVTEDGTITINGNILDKLNSNDKIKFIKSALSVKTANGTTMADSTIFDLRTMPFNDNIYGQDAKRDFKLKFENTPGRIIISKTEDDQLPTIGLDYKTEDIENLKYEGKYVFVDYGKEKPDTDQIEYLKKSARSGYTYTKDNKLIMVDFSLGEEEIELTLSADINNLQGEIMKSEGPVVIDIMKFLEYFENPGTDKMSKFEYFNKLINSFASLKKLSKNKAIETLYNISFESLPNNINDIDLENDISEIGIMYRGIKEEKIKEEFINTLKNRIVVKNRVREERNIDLEQNKNNKNLEKMLAKILSKQEELKGENINIEEIKIDVENKTIKENKDEYEEILRDNNISEILKKDVSEMTNSEKKIVAKLEILIPVIMDDKNPEISNRNNNNDMARDYRAMLAAA